MESLSRFSGISFQVRGRAISIKQQPTGESRTPQEESEGSMAGMGSLGRGSRNGTSGALCVQQSVNSLGIWWLTFQWGHQGSTFHSAKLLPTGNYSLAQKNLC